MRKLLPLLVCCLAMLLLPADSGAAAPGDVAWSTRYRASSDHKEFAIDVVASPDGTRVYSVGQSRSDGTDWDIVTIAYDAITGAQIWAARYDSTSHRRDQPSSLVLSADGASVYVGGSTATAYTSDALTIAYDARTGGLRWVRRCCGREGGVTSVLDTSGSLVVMTTGSRGGLSVVAYDAQSGTRRWRSDSSGYVDATAESLMIGDGRVLFVGERRQTDNYVPGYLVLAFDLATGAALWSRHYAGNGSSPAGQTSGTLSPDATRLYVTGVAANRHAHRVVTTLAFDTATADRIWISRIRVQEGGDDQLPIIEVSPDGAALFVAAKSYAAGSFSTLLLRAYAAADGSVLWTSRNDAPGSTMWTADIAVAGDSRRVYVSGLGTTASDQQRGWVVLSYDAAAGGPPLWGRWIRDPLGIGVAWGIDVAPDGSLVYVAGWLDGNFVTKAFAGP